jgi:hypothetical protein
MNLKPDTFVPSLRWRMGEYQALTRLSDAAKDRIVPFIVIPEIEYDFEDERPKKTVEEHVHTFPKRYKQKWGNRPAWIDVHPKIVTSQMDNGKVPIAYVFDEIAAFANNAVPVTSLDVPSAVNKDVGKIVSRDGRGVGIRARIEHVMKPSFANAVATLTKSIGIPSDKADLIIDLGGPNYLPYADFADGLIAALKGVDASAYRSFVVMGCAYPKVVALDKPGGFLPRHDWEFYKILYGKLDGKSRIPNYSDYAIVHPEFTPLDMRKIKSGGKVVYTVDGRWMVRKGGPFRDDRKQMHKHCADIVASGKFRGPAFSAGDDYIEKCAKKQASPSNQTRWKEVAVNHHIMHVLDDLSNFV